MGKAQEACAFSYFGLRQGGGFETRPTVPDLTIRQTRHFQPSQDASRLGWNGIPQMVGRVLCRKAAGNRDVFDASASYDTLSVVADFDTRISKSE